MTRIAVLTPTRGDRPQFAKLYRLYIERQDIRPDFIEIVNDRPISAKQKDLVYRCKLGTDRIAAKVADLNEKPEDCLVLFVEDDDWYPFNYVNYMFQQWKNYNCPDLIGINSTVYYHLFRRSYRILKHPGRASLMSTGAKLSALMDLNWGDIKEPFLDLRLWKLKKGVAFEVDEPVCIGIKHGIGLCGGGGHRPKPNRSIGDVKFAWLNSIVGPDIRFYKEIVQ